MAQQLILQEDESRMSMLTYLARYGHYYQAEQSLDGRWLDPLVACEPSESNLFCDTFISFDRVPLDILVNWARELMGKPKWIETRPDYSHPLSPKCRLSTALNVISQQARRQGSFKDKLSKVMRHFSRCISQPTESVVLVVDVLDKCDIQPAIDDVKASGRAVKLVACFVNTVSEDAFWHKTNNPKESIPVVSLADIRVRTFRTTDDPYLTEHLADRNNIINPFSPRDG